MVRQETVLIGGYMKIQSVTSIAATNGLRTIANMDEAGKEWITDPDFSKDEIRVVGLPRPRTKVNIYREGGRSNFLSLPRLFRRAFTDMVLTQDQIVEFLTLRRHFLVAEPGNYTIFCTVASKRNLLVTVRGCSVFSRGYIGLHDPATDFEQIRNFSIVLPAKRP